MTDEQIEQKANEFATHINGEKSPFSSREYEAYIAGAHSMLEEIEDLRMKLALLIQLNDQQEKVISTQNLLLEQLRNPWISVKDHLPDYPESEYDIDNMYLVCREGSSMAFPAIFRRDGKWYIFDNTQIREIITPDYWMPMPAKKGE